MSDEIGASFSNPLAAAEALAGVAFDDFFEAGDVEIGEHPFHIFSCEFEAGPEFRQDGLKTDGLRYLVFLDRAIIGSVKVVQDANGYRAVSAEVNRTPEATRRAFELIGRESPKEGWFTPTLVEIPELGIYHIMIAENGRFIDRLNRRVYDDEQFRKFYHRRWHGKQAIKEPGQDPGPEGAAPPL